MEAKGVVSRGESPAIRVDCRWRGFELLCLCRLSGEGSMREFFEPDKITDLVSFTTVTIPEEFI